MPSPLPPPRICLMVIHNLPVHFLIDAGNQLLQTHNAALSRLEGLAVLAIHGAEAQERQLCLRFYQPGLSGAAEHLGKMQLLPLVHHIDELDPDDRSSHRSTRWLPDPWYCTGKRRRISGSCRAESPWCPYPLLHPPPVRPHSSWAKPLSFSILHHLRDIGLRIRFTLPQVKIHIQVLIILLQVGRQTRLKYAASSAR